MGVITTDNPHFLVDLPRNQDLDTIPSYSADDPEGNMPHAVVLTGSDLFQMTDSQWKQTLCYREIVFARTSPQQKLQITKRFQDAGYVFQISKQLNLTCISYLHLSILVTLLRSPVMEVRFFIKAGYVILNS